MTQITTADIVKDLHELYNNAPDKTREYVIVTGQSGAEMIQDHMEKNNNADFADFLHEKGVIRKCEAERLRQMIFSDDRENYELAKIILQEKSTLITPQKYGYNAIVYKDKGVIK